MDLNEAIRSLCEEKKKLDKLIASLESVLADGKAPAVPRSKPRRRRKQLTAQRRQAISERMQKYWAARRAQAETVRRGPEPAGAPASDATEFAPAGS